MTTSQVCKICGREHVPGSAAFRDCQQQAFEDFVTDPTRWVFSPTDSQREAVRQAHLRAKTEFSMLPDVSVLRKLICVEFESQGEDGTSVEIDKMMEFWQDFSSDMPDILKQHGAVLREVELAWSDRKIVAILKELKLPYMEWETKELAADVRAPGQLREVAAKMEEAEADGHALYHFEVTGSQVTWLFRKGKPQLAEV